VVKITFSVMKLPEHFGQHKGVDGQIQLVNYRNATRFERLIEQRKYPYKQSSPMALQVRRKRARKASVLEQGNWAIVPRLYAHRSNAQDTPLRDVAKRGRCSKCGQRGCEFEAVPLHKPQGWTMGSPKARPEGRNGAGRT
jgi:hypothetical protein